MLTKNRIVTGPFEEQTARVGIDGNGSLQLGVLILVPDAVSSAYDLAIMFSFVSTGLRGTLSPLPVII